MEPANYTIAMSVRLALGALGAVLWCMWLLLSGVSAATPESWDEYDVKTAWLKHFTTYVEWPATRFAGPDAPFVLGVMGDSPFGKRLEEMASRNKVRGRPMVVRAITALDQIGEAHMLFVCQSELEQLPAIVRAAEQHSVLTVSDMPYFDKRGGMIRLCRVERRIIFTINLPQGMAARLVFDARFSQMSKPCPSASPP